MVERVVTLGQNEHLLLRWARRRLPVGEGMDGEGDKERGGKVKREIGNEEERVEGARKLPG